MRGVLILLVLTGLFSCRPQRAAQLDEAARMTPRSYKSIGTTRAHSDALRTLKARVWVDPRYQRDVVRWRERIEDQFERTSAMGETAAALHIEVVSIEEWQPEGRELGELLAELAEHDDGRGVDLVVAMTGSLPGFTDSQHQLGFAQVLGKHIVVRAMNDAAEWQQFESKFTRLSDDEKRAVYRERLRHKEAATLLHEVAHTLGAMHSKGEGYLMSPMYDANNDRFCAANEELLSKSLAARGDDFTAWRREAIKIVREVADRDGGKELDASLLSSLEESADALGPEAISKLQEIDRLLASDEAAAALSIAEGLLKRLPDHPVVAGAYCHSAIKAGAEAKHTLRACTNAHRLNPKSYPSAANLALLHVRMRQWDEAEKYAAVARGLLDADEKAAASEWHRMGLLYMSLLMPSMAEDALDKAAMLADAEETRANAKSIRYYWCIPRGSIEPAEEGRAIRALTEAFDRLESGEKEPANELAKKYPDVPGVRALQCSVALREGRPKEAEKLCTSALSNGPCYLAHYTLGGLLANRNELDSARKHLETARALYDEDPNLDQMLRRIYEHQKDREALKRLEKAK